MSNNSTSRHPYSPFNPCSYFGRYWEKLQFFFSRVISLSFSFHRHFVSGSNGRKVFDYGNNLEDSDSLYILLCGLVFTDLCTGLIAHSLYVAVNFICLDKSQELKNELSTSLLLSAIVSSCRSYFISGCKITSYRIFVNGKMAAHDRPSIFADCAP